MHYSQALLDIYDDFEDVDEDLREMMPNVFILAATERTIFSKILKNPSHARKLIVCSGAMGSVLTLVDQYNRMIKEITLPQNFALLKYLSKGYTDRLLTALDVLPR